MLVFSSLDLKNYLLNGVTPQKMDVTRKITILEAKLKAEMEFDKYRVFQDKNYESDFDKEIKKLKG
jgi:hypothetical protein